MVEHECPEFGNYDEHEEDCLTCLDADICKKAFRDTGSRYTLLAKPVWCSFCDAPASYDAEALNGQSVYVCKMRKHKDELTGRRRSIKRLKL